MEWADYSNRDRPAGRGTLDWSMRVLGIDFGRKRIGLALSDATGMLARPWKAIPAASGTARIAADLADEVDRLSREPDGLAAVVIGWPRRLSGDANEQTPLVEALAAALKELIAVPVVLQDERLTSHEAEQLLTRREKDWRKRKAHIDAAAAALILQDYLDTK